MKLLFWLKARGPEPLIDSDSQLSSISLAWVNKLKLNPQLWSMLKIEGVGGLDVP